MVMAPNPSLWASGRGAAHPLLQAAVEFMGGRIPFVALHGETWQSGRSETGMSWATDDTDDERDLHELLDRIQAREARDALDAREKAERAARAARENAEREANARREQLYACARGRRRQLDTGRMARLGLQGRRSKYRIHARTC
jgi:hypothetical protein